VSNKLNLPWMSKCFHLTVDGHNALEEI